MRLVKIEARGFRCFGEQNPLSLTLRPGLNILVGANDAGKTAIVDAIRLALGTRSEEWLRIDASDFHTGKTGRASQLFIRCTFDDLDASEQTRFLEWCTLESGRLRLYVYLSGRLLTSNSGDKVVWTRRTGRDGDGPAVEGTLREFLAITYLRPLRDAEREMSPGRRSRLSQILASTAELKEQNREGADEVGRPRLRQIIKDADDAIQRNHAIRKLQDRVNSEYLKGLSLLSAPLSARLGIGAELGLPQLLERLRLELAGVDSHTVLHGLGNNNVLFMAAELLLLGETTEQLPFLSIEEPEAHLHPQLQSRFMRMLEAHVQARVQILLTTHSPILAAGADLNAMVLVAGAQTFPLDEGQTGLAKPDYPFLRRFLDATKANLFFASGVLLVEGDAENILLPSLAEKLGRPLADHGVSIVNVGHTGLFRYSRIFQRTTPKPGSSASVRASQNLDLFPNDLRQPVEATCPPIPVACITDRDLDPGAAEKDIRGVEERKKEKYEGGLVKVFVSTLKTLEFDLALAGFAVEVHQAIRLVQGGEHANREKVMADAAAEVQEWRTLRGSDAVLAARIYEPLIKDRSKVRVSKPEVAEQLSQIISDCTDSPEVFSQRVPSYLREAIYHVTGGPPNTAFVAPPPLQSTSAADASASV